VTDVGMSVCLDGIKLLNRYSSSYSFCLILTNLGTHDLRVYQYTEKLWNRFSNFDLKIFGRVFKFQIWTSSL